MAKGVTGPPHAPACPPPCCPQIMLLETARRYNHETECITFLKDFTYSKDDFHRAGTAEGRRGRRRAGRPAWETSAASPV